MLPEAFLNRIHAQLGEEYEDFLKSLERPRAVALRFNPLKGERAQLPFVGERVAWEEEGFYYEPTARPGLHPYHEAGVYYLQEASAMAPVTMLAPQPGERVCDLCAAPGGKSTQIAAHMRGEGLLVCNEIHPSRAKILSRNIERLGIANAVVTNESPETLAKKLPSFFDRVLVDAPCSGEGMFRKEEAAVTDWSVETVQMCARRQRLILHEAASLLRPGGRLVYSTCTFSPEENEQTVEAFLHDHPEFSPEEVDAPWFTPAGTGAFRLWPHKLPGEGHFLAVLRKAGQESPQIACSDGETLPPQWLDFAKDMAISLPEGKALFFGSSLYWCAPQTPSLRGLKVLRAGLELGEVKKDRLEPAHALALWLKDAARTVELSAQGEQIRAYLRGETLPCTQKGRCLVRVDGYGIGWGKSDGVTLKNHYPKGLRRV